MRQIKRVLPLIISLSLASILILLVNMPISAKGLEGGRSAGDDVQAIITSTPANETATPSLAPSVTFAPALTSTITSTATTTPSVTATPTITFTPTDSATPTPTPSTTPSPTTPPFSYLPAMRRDLPKPTPRPPEKFLYCSSPNSEIPDDNPLGLRDRITIADERKVIEINLYLYVTHTWIGDLVVGLERADIGSSVTILDRPGVPSSQNGCEHNNLIAIFDDRGSQAAEYKCAYSPAAISGTFKPAQPLSSFVDQPAAGEWEINLIDNYPNDSGSLHEWCLEITLGDTIPPPTPTPTPFSPPASALIGDITGQNQAMPLDCESRSAVDWAAYFGFPINEYEFFYNLPQSDNPDTGFVGNVWGEWGNIPPDDYGVHAPPIAQLLRDYGLVASAYRSISWDDLRAEIASGRPAIVWIIGRINYGLPRFYTPSDGQTTVVARFEHTVIVIGYTETTVTVLNGEAIETYSLDQFLDSWSVLRNMAVLARP